MTFGEENRKAECPFSNGPNNEVNSSFVRIINVETFGTDTNDCDSRFILDGGKQSKMINLRLKIAQAIEEANTELFQRCIEELETMVKEGTIRNLQDTRLVHSNGMSLLQFAIFIGNEEAAQELLNIFGRDFKPFESEAFKGGSALHHAILQDMPEIVKRIAENIEEFNMFSASRATGSFYKDTFDGFELPLFLACWSRNFDMVRLLFEINPHVFHYTDSRQQNLLHCLVNLSSDATEEVKEFIERVIKMIVGADGGKMALECLMEMKDDREETPMSLAFRKAEYHIIHVILNHVLRKVKSRYGSSSAIVEYDISCFESIKTVSGKKSPSAPGMYYIGTSNDTTRFPGILFQQPFQKLLSMRNKAYRKQFILSMIWNIFLMGWLVFNARQKSIANSIRANAMSPNGTISTNSDSLQVNEVTTARNIAFVNDCFFLAYGILSFLKEIIQLVCQLIKGKRQFHLSWFELMERQFNTVTGTGGFALLYAIFSSSLAVASLQYLSGSEIGHVSSAMAIQLCSLYFTFYLRYFGNTAFYFLTVKKMLFGDVVRFLLTVVGIFFGFTGAFFLLYDDANRTPDVATYGDTMLTTYKLMLGMADLQSLNGSDTYMVTNVYLIMSYICFTTIVTILMFNMLIGIMANTINEVAEHKDDLFELQKLSCSMHMERQLFWSKGFAKNAFDKGQLKIKTVTFAGKEQMRLFIECLEVKHGKPQVNEQQNDHHGKRNKTYMGNYNIHSVSYFDSGDR